ncbi:MAG: hypothetical protein F4Y24_08885 [Gemmatimonadetes bacterium]|nr:hypothetical protein [Gemmatimonadota bacterium]MYJ39132.1 hypothetical protein [Gemmatimonadota bacterium]
MAQSTGEVRVVMDFVGVLRGPNHTLGGRVIVRGGTTSLSKLLLIVPFEVLTPRAMLSPPGHPQLLPIEVHLR